MALERTAVSRAIEAKFKDRNTQTGIHEKSNISAYQNRIEDIHSLIETKRLKIEQGVYYAWNMYHLSIMFILFPLLP